MDKLQQLFNELKNLIEKEVGETPQEFTYGKFDGLGWLYFHYTCSTYEGPYPRIVLKQQKNAVHLYIMLWIDGKPISENYAHLFGKTGVGKSCLRIKNLNEERKKALIEMIGLAKKADRI